MIEPEGPLAEFLARPELHKMLDNGTMSPDGGYPLGDPYGEMAHWEPFQTDFAADTTYTVTVDPGLGVGAHEGERRCARSVWVAI